MEFDRVIGTRRSIRAYKAGMHVSPETVEEILRTASQAPSWKNSQTARTYVVLEEPMLSKVRETCLPEFNQRNCRNASALLVTTFVKGISGCDNEGNPANELGDQWGAYDLGLHNAFLILKARDLGLDTLIMGIRDGEKLRELLSIPQQEQVAAVIALGYRDADPQMPRRKELSETAEFL